MVTVAMQVAEAMVEVVTVDVVIGVEGVKALEGARVVGAAHSGQIQHRKRHVYLDCYLHGHLLLGRRCPQ